MQVPYYSDVKDPHSVDSKLAAAPYMGYMILNYMHKNWKANVCWLHLSFPKVQEQFRQGMRYDAVGHW